MFASAWCIGSSGRSNQAGVLGFEPRQADPESAVLPLHHTPSRCIFIVGSAAELSSFAKMKRRAFTLVGLPVVRRFKRAAFTLVELLMVIGIIALLIAILV